MAGLYGDRNSVAFWTSFTTTGDPGRSVLRSSALLDERVGQEWTPFVKTPIAWSQVHFLSRDHLGITKDPQFADNVLYLLLDSPR